MYDIGYDLGPVPVGQVRGYVIEIAPHPVAEGTEPAGPQIGDLEAAADPVILIGAGQAGVDQREDTGSGDGAGQAAPSVHLSNDFP